ncbi:MAG: von Willebrand factor type A domain-containing protein, partial [Thiomargarita sp.]|nr:von Willebrand factor type A domain-containing protein [Thiomargarita sp.]
MYTYQLLSIISICILLLGGCRFTEPTKSHDDKIYVDSVERIAENEIVDDGIDEEGMTESNQAALWQKFQPRLDIQGIIAEQNAGTSALMAPRPEAIIPEFSMDREQYEHFDDNAIKQASKHPVSTFSIDVDTGSYSNVRRMLKEGQLPRHDAVRVEEMINYFSYDYPVPKSTNLPFQVTTEIAPTPWNKKTHLLHIGIKGSEVSKNKLPPANLVFLVDVSGSMSYGNQLELVKSSLILLSKHLTAKDRVSIVVYAGADG